MHPDRTEIAPRSHRDRTHQTTPMPSNYLLNTPSKCAKFRQVSSKRHRMTQISSHDPTHTLLRTPPADHPDADPVWTAPSRPANDSSFKNLLRNDDAHPKHEFNSQTYKLLPHPPFLLSLTEISNTPPEKSLPRFCQDLGELIPPPTNSTSPRLPPTITHSLRPLNYHHHLTSPTNTPDP